MAKRLVVIAAAAVLPLVDVLRVVAKVHPFVEGACSLANGRLYTRAVLKCAMRDVIVAVNAFAIVVELNLKRRESDRKIDVLFASMRDTMATLRR
ncbi:hypothetical protein C8Q80DRAFT_1212327 [Daedaleopsis nitida]|nr:hypothetical protein C8Q80DRAFT_1212327 [Daedaleopsis nitida]